MKYLALIIILLSPLSHAFQDYSSLWVDGKFAYINGRSISGTFAKTDEMDEQIALCAHEISNRLSLYETVLDIELFNNGCRVTARPLFYARDKDLQLTVYAKKDFDFSRLQDLNYLHSYFDVEISEHIKKMTDRYPLFQVSLERAGALAPSETNRFPIILSFTYQVVRQPKTFTVEVRFIIVNLSDTHAPMPADYDAALRELQIRQKIVPKFHPLAKIDFEAPFSTECARSANTTCIYFKYTVTNP